ncbi:aminotransferase [Aerococcus urinaehominis]|uniref:cysteine-S-conjugate beta-lyase n=1 Tax=Aerococcus urinaehominis TaxID=128944 RepID=A0A0X8FLJ5_9LACT|nr:PatB family C-S lyase [Aerococcus urinaehominis]AMB99304.1 aminotransferase [Aerococcus urinaehominis]SDM19601.1 cystathione beta-lyase [Aerococcus urinaehominis]
MVDVLKDLSPDREGSPVIKWTGMTGKYGANDLLPLWIADMDFGTVPEVVQALVDYTERNQYGYFSVPDSYYQALIKWAKDHFNYTTEASWYRYTPGVCTGLALALQAFTNEGDKVLIQNPVYDPFRTVVLEANRELVMQDLLGDDEAGYRMDFDSLEAAFKDGVKVFILCSPHNPIGRIWSQEELTKVIDLCCQYDVFLFADEIHRDLIMPGHEFITTGCLVNDFDKLVIFTAASKTFNLAAFSHSFMIIKNPDLRAIYDRYTKTIHLGTGAPAGYIAAEAAFTHGQDWLDQVIDIVWENYQTVKASLAEFPAIKIADLQATYLCFVDLGAYVSPDQLTSLVQDQAGLAVNYGRDYWPTKPDDCHIRLNLATRPDIIRQAMDQLTQALKNHHSA